MMPIQRVCGAEMQARNKLSNGPLRVRMKAFLSVFRNVQADVICRGYDSILLRARIHVNSRWHRG